MKQRGSVPRSVAMSRKSRSRSGRSPCKESASLSQKGACASALYRRAGVDVYFDVHVNKGQGRSRAQSLSVCRMGRRAGAQLPLGNVAQAVQ